MPPVPTPAALLASLILTAGVGYAESGPEGVTIESPLKVIPLAAPKPILGQTQKSQVSLGNPRVDKVWALVGPDTKPAAWPATLPAGALRTQPFGSDVMGAWKRAMTLMLSKPADSPSEDQSKGRNGDFTKNANGKPTQTPASGNHREALAKARLDLCLISKAQGRFMDTWWHFARLTDFPEMTSRALPYLWPGIPMGTEIHPGMQLRLPKDALIAPAFPPAPVDDEPDLPGPLIMHFAGHLTIAGVPLDLRSTLQNTGLELDLLHRGTEPVQIRVEMPRPRNFQRDLIYSDWERVDGLIGPLPVVLPVNREGAWTLFVRLKPAFEPWPASPDALSGWFQDRKLALALQAGESHDDGTLALARHLSELLGIPVTCIDHDATLDLRTTRVDLGSSKDRALRIGRLLSSVERFLLHPVGK